MSFSLPLIPHPPTRPAPPSSPTLAMGAEWPSIWMPRAEPVGQYHIFESMPPDTIPPSGRHVTHETHLPGGRGGRQVTHDTHQPGGAGVDKEKNKV